MEAMGSLRVLTVLGFQRGKQSPSEMKDSGLRGD